MHECVYTYTRTHAYMHAYIHTYTHDTWTGRHTYSQHGMHTYGGFMHVLTHRQTQTIHMNIHTYIHTYKFMFFRDFALHLLCMPPRYSETRLLSDGMRGNAERAYRTAVFICVRMSVLLCLTQTVNMNAYTHTEGAQTMLRKMPISMNRSHGLRQDRTANSRKNLIQITRAHHILAIHTKKEGSEQP
jgi:hypothetical protein